MKIGIVRECNYISHEEDNKRDLESFLIETYDENLTLQEIIVEKATRSYTMGDLVEIKLNANEGNQYSKIEDIGANVQELKELYKLIIAEQKKLKLEQNEIIDDSDESVQITDNENNKIKNRQKTITLLAKKFNSESKMFDLDTEKDLKRLFENLYKELLKKGPLYKLSFKEWEFYYRIYSIAKRKGIFEKQFLTDFANLLLEIEVVDIKNINEEKTFNQRLEILTSDLLSQEIKNIKIV